MPQLHVLRVFTADDGSEGNPLGVFLDGAELPSEQRQAIAADLGYSETVFIDARKLGVLTDRVHRELTDDEIERVAGTYHEWRSKGKSKYEDVAGFCMSAALDEIRNHGHVLTPGRYVGAEEIEDDGEPFAEKMPRLVSTLSQQFGESRDLEESILANLEGLGYGD